MSNQGNAVTVSKAKIAQFVHDAADMEKREYILRGIAAKLNSQEKAIRSLADDDVREQQKICLKFRAELNAEEAKLNAAKQELAEAEETRTRLCTILERKNMPTGSESFDEYGAKLPEKPGNEEEYNKYKKKLKKYNNVVPNEKYFSFKTFLIGILPAFFVGVIAMGIIAIIWLEIFGDASWFTEFLPQHVEMFFLIPTILWLILYIGIIVHSRVEHKNFYEMHSFVERYEHEYEEYQKQLAMPAKKREEAQEEFRKCSAKVDKYLASVEEIKGDLLYNEEGLRKDEEWREREYKRADWIHTQFVKIVETLNDIHENKLKLYGIGIVPPDYRTLDATLMIANIFDNDLADTMREAVLLYDERVHRGEVIRGLDNINKSLNSLNQTMHVVVNCLNDINTSINRVALEINGVANQIHSMNYDVQKMGGKILAGQQKMAEEARATRYATEELNESQEVLNRYIEDRRNGLI